MRADGGGNWSTNGCELVSYNKSTGEVQCKCSHLTNFAILVVSPLLIAYVVDTEREWLIIHSLQNVNAPPISNEVRDALEALSIIGSVLSIIGLVITIFTMLFFKWDMYSYYT